MYIYYVMRRRGCAFQEFMMLPAGGEAPQERRPRLGMIVRICSLSIYIYLYMLYHVNIV